MSDILPSQTYNATSFPWLIGCKYSPQPSTRDLTYYDQPLPTNNSSNTAIIIKCIKINFDIFDSTSLCDWLTYKSIPIKHYYYYILLFSHIIECKYSLQFNLFLQPIFTSIEAPEFQIHCMLDKINQLNHFEIIRHHSIYLMMNRPKIVNSLIILKIVNKCTNWKIFFLESDR